MPRSIFVSHVYEDRQWVAQLKDWVTNGSHGSDLGITTELYDLRPLGDAAIDGHLSPRIRGASVLLVLVGQDTHSHQWVRREIELATSFGKKIVLLRIPNTTGAVPTNARNLSTVLWSPGALKVALEG